MEDYLSKKALEGTTLRFIARSGEFAHHIPDLTAGSSEFRPDYSVVIPFYNEAANAASLLAEVDATMQGLCDGFGGYEVLMVNDGSTDNTAEILAHFAAGRPPYRLINLSPNRGQAGALYHGLKAAAAPLIITMDGDGQNCPTDIPGLRVKLGNADMIVGIRQNRQDSSFRRQISRLANAVRRRMLDDGMSDSGCALKVFRCEVVSSFIPIRTLYSFMPAMAVAAGFRVVEAPVAHRARGGGKSNYGLKVFLWRPVLDLLGVWWFSKRRFREVFSAPTVATGNTSGTSSLSAPSANDRTGRILSAQVTGFPAPAVTRHDIGA